jgi:hypothetical protein
MDSAPDALLKGVAAGAHGGINALLGARSDPNQPHSEGTHALIYFELSDLFTGFLI